MGRVVNSFGSDACVASSATRSPGRVSKFVFCGLRSFVLCFDLFVVLAHPVLHSSGLV